MPEPVALGTALARSEPLARLRAQLADSRARLATILPRLPPALHNQVSAGPVDETGWSLLVDNNSVAAKLRQLRPHLEQALVQAGWPAGAERVRVLGRG